MSDIEGAGAPARLQRAQGVQVGHHNAQYNTWVIGASGAVVPGVAVGPVVVGEIPQEPVAFRPREELLAGLRSVGPGVAVVTTVTGMRGAGKTQVAAAFARECAAAGWRLVGWVNAQDAGLVLAGLAVVAARLGIAPEAGAEDAALAVRNWLEADGRSCLLVFDNVADLGMVRRFVPAAGQSRVVVTATGALSGVRGTVVPVGVFSEDDGLAFLAERTGLDDMAGARALAEELGWLPLGLAQAGAVIAAQRLSYQVYLGRLRQVPVEEYLAAGLGEPYPHGVAEAVLLSLDAVAGDDPAGELCRAVLDIVAMLSPAGVPRSLLYEAAESGELPGYDGSQGARLVDEAVGRLAGGSLLSFSGDGNSVAAHRLVMRVARERVMREGDLVPLGQWVSGLLSSVMGSLEEPWRNRAAARDLIGQLIALHQHMQPYLGDDSSELEAQLLWLRGVALQWLNALGDAGGLAVEFGRSVVSDCERVLGEDHPHTLASRNNLAVAYEAAGRLGEAIPLFEATLVDRERLQGDVPDTLTSRNNLAAAYRAAGRVGEAVPLLERTLADRERLLGKDHPDTLASRSNLAYAYLAAGRVSEAVLLCEATLAARERLLGEDHPSTLMSRNNLAGAYEAAGRLGEAVPLFEATLTDSARLLGEDHPSTLMSRSNLAVVYEAAGRLGEAVPLFEATLAARERLLGKDHPDTLASRNNLAYAYQGAGRAGEAILLYEATLADHERVLGRAHPDTVAVRNNLAYAYQAAGRSSGEGGDGLDQHQ